MCLHLYRHGQPQRNTQLGDMIDFVRQLLSKRLKVTEQEEEEKEEERDGGEEEK